MGNEFATALDDVIEAGAGFLTAIGVLDEDRLRSRALQGSDELMRLADNPDFTPIPRNKGTKPLVSALQRALKLAGYSLGKYGPDKDGVDGDFGAATEKALKAFQKEHGPALSKAGVPAFRGKPVEVPVTGKLDWATLQALDAYVAKAEGGGTSQKKLVTAYLDRLSKVEPPKPVAVVPPSKEFVFDAKGKALSLQFGLRMYQALLRWLWVKKSDGTFQGVGYSTTVAGDYGTFIPAQLRPEWPDLTGLVEADEHVDVGGKKVPVYKFGTKWKGTHFTNCTNSQCAAFYVAAGGKGFSVKQADGALVRYAFSSDEPKLSTRTSAKGAAANRSALTVFQQTFVTGSQYFDANGKSYWLKGAEGSPSAVAALRCGEVVSTLTKDPTALRKLRLGDLANSTHHAFMIGDVRYSVWFKDGKHGKQPDAVVDQSSFIDGAVAKAVAIGTKNPKEVVGRTPVSAADCEWLLAHEAEFEQRVQAFHDAPTVTLDGVTKSIEKFQVTHFRVFSANGDRETVHGARRGTRTMEQWRGVTRPWKEITPICWARFYAPA